MEGDEPTGVPAGVGWEDGYRQHADRLIRLATVLVGPDHAPDLVSVAVHRAVHSPGWAQVRDVGAYLTTTLVNESKQHHRERSRRRDREERALRLAATDGRAVELPLELDVHRALAALSPQQRAVVYLAYWEDRTIPAIAEQLAVSEGTVRKQLARAKKTLKGHLDAH